MKLSIGEHIVTNEDQNLDHWMQHLHTSMNHEEREELFHEARRDGKAHFSPKTGIHLVLKRDSLGTYTLEKE